LESSWGQGVTCPQSNSLVRNGNHLRVFNRGWGDEIHKVQDRRLASHKLWGWIPGHSVMLCPQCTTTSSLIFIENLQDLGTTKSAFYYLIYTSKWQLFQ
jgi:hypothetical protein